MSILCSKHTSQSLILLYTVYIIYTISINDQETCLDMMVDHLVCMHICIVSEVSNAHVHMT